MQNIFFVEVFRAFPDFPKTFLRKLRKTFFVEVVKAFPPSRLLLEGSPCNVEFMTFPIPDVSDLNMTNFSTGIQNSNGAGTGIAKQTRVGRQKSAARR